SGAITASLTLPSWPARVATSAPVATFHSFAVPSPLAVIAVVPSGENRADQNHALCPSSVWTSSPVSTFHTRATLSSPAAISRRPWTSIAGTWPFAPANVLIGAPLAANHDRTTPSAPAV